MSLERAGEDEDARLGLIDVEVEITTRGELACAVSHGSATAATKASTPMIESSTC